jgi:hypothetical protein
MSSLFSGTLMLTFSRPRDARSRIPYRLALQLRRTKRHANGPANVTNPVRHAVAAPIEQPAVIDAGQVIESARARGVIGNDSVLQRLESTVGPAFLRATIVSLLAP